jgi:prepilin-type N-terminal cleavage/methylation domain-containing protein
MRPSPRAAGFTLIELLVAIAVLAIFIVAILGLLDSSQRVAKTESALADTQENVRYAAYHLLRTARMAGASNMPFAQNVSGADYWLAARTLTNPGSFTDDFGADHNVAPGSDVLVVRGFFERSPYFVSPANVDVAGRKVTVNERNAARTLAQGGMDVTGGEFAGFGLVLMGRGQYAVAEIHGNTASSPADTPDRTFDITWEQAAGAPWDDLNPDATFTYGTASATGPPFDVYRVGILESYTYYVSTDFQLRRVRHGGVDEPVAISIGNLQCAIGADTDDNGTVDTWFDEPTNVSDVLDKGPPVKRPMAIRITVLGRTADPVMYWNEPSSTFQVEDLSLGDVDIHAKWRLMRVTATLRDYML